MPLAVHVRPQLLLGRHRQLCVDDAGSFATSSLHPTGEGAVPGCGCCRWRHSTSGRRPSADAVLQRCQAFREPGLAGRPQLRLQLAATAAGWSATSAIAPIVRFVVITSSAARWRLGSPSPAPQRAAGRRRHGGLEAGAGRLFAVEHLAEDDCSHRLRPGGPSEHPGVTAARVESELHEAGVELASARRCASHPRASSSRRRRRHR